MPSDKKIDRQDLPDPIQKDTRKDGFDEYDERSGDKLVENERQEQLSDYEDGSVNKSRESAKSSPDAGRS
jgi:hypothetical protein